MSACVPGNKSSPGAKRAVNQGDNSAAQTGSSNQTQSQNTDTSAPPVVTPPVDQASDCYKGDAFACKIEALITTKTNKYRAMSRLGQLRQDSKMSFIARDWSVKQANRGFIGHTGFPSARNAAYRAEFQQPFSFGSENVAYTGRVGGRDESDAAAERIAQEFAVMWWNSPGHRRNMLGNFSTIGVGVHKKMSGSWYATQLFK